MMQINNTVGVNRHSDYSKLLSCPMESQLLPWPCFNQQTVQILEFFIITDLAVSARSDRSKSEFYVSLSVDTWYLKIQANSRISLLPLLVFTITLYISAASKNHFSCLPDLPQPARWEENWFKQKKGWHHSSQNKRLFREVGY